MLEAPSYFGQKFIRNVTHTAENSLIWIELGHSFLVRFLIHWMWSTNAGRGTIKAGRGTIRTCRTTIRAGSSTIRTRRSTNKAGRSMIKAGRSTIKAGRSTIKAGSFWKFWDLSCKNTCTFILM